MEQKTMGKFISALRKAEGMTQKDLAEKLNVSDKSVSRWERDEGAPDISVLPVIAEIFGITCDELLRGERKPVDQRNEITEEITAKADKQLRRLMKSSMSKYLSQSCIAMGVAVMGFIAAMIANLAFLQALLGFLLGLVFLVAALVCQAVFMNKAFLSVEDAEIDSLELSRFKLKVIRIGSISIGLSAFLFGFILPLAFVSAYLGMGAGGTFLYGAISGGALLLLYSVVLYFVNSALVKKGIIILDEKELQRYHKIHKLKAYVAMALAVVLLVTGLCHYSCTILDGPGSVMKGISFDDYESFITFMEKRVPQSQRYGQVAVGVEEVPADPAETIYYDMEGNVLTEEEARHRTLTDNDGNVVCEYTQWNENVRSVSYSPKDGTILPITVKTYDDLYRAEALVSGRNKIFTMVYPVELALAVVIYFILKRKLIK